MALDIRNDKHKHEGSSVPWETFKTLDTLEEINIMYVSRVSSKEFWRTSLIPEWIQDDFALYVKNDIN